MERKIKVPRWFHEGNLLKKKNKQVFGKESPVLLVESYKNWNSNNYLINNNYVLNENNIEVISDHEAKILKDLWDSCNRLGFFTPVINRHPCFREDNITPKVKIKDEDRQNALFRMIMKTNDYSFQIYKCPSCQNLHVGRNPYKKINLLLPEKII